MINKTKISLNLTGIVLFDPIVVDKFVTDNDIDETDLLKYFNDHPEVGNKAINEGVLIPVYTITAWDYTIILNTETKSSVRPDWKLFVTETNFPLQVIGNTIIISDIYAILEWNKDYYLNFPPRDERVGVDDDLKIDSGLYSVNILGFRDKENPDKENRECGYEFLLQKVEILPEISNVNIDEFNFKVDGVVPDSN